MGRFAAGRRGGGVAVDRAQLKQRLVGAAVLIAVAVIVVPVVLNFGHEREWWGQRSAVPAPPPQGFVTRVLPLDQWSKAAESELAAGTAILDKPPEPPAAASVPVPAQPPAASSAPPAHQASSPRSPPSPPAPPAPPSPPAPTKPAPPVAFPPAPTAWVVQLGSFSSKKNADDLSAFLAKKGFRAFVDHGAQGGDSVYRVRVGPEKDRGQADTLRERVERETQLRAIVLRYP